MGSVKGRRAGIAPGWMEETSLETAPGILYLRLEQFYSQYIQKITLPFAYNFLKFNSVLLTIKFCPLFY